MNTKNNNKKISFSFSRAEKYKNENDQLHEQIQKAEFEVNDLLQINQVRLFDIDMLECFFLISLGSARRISSFTK
jgi:hypothetical protein